AYPYVYFFKYPDTFRRPRGIEPEEYGEILLGEIERTLQVDAYGKGFAAIIFEPIQGDGGVLVPPKSFIVGLRKIADEYGIVLIDDEIQTGFGRTGKMFAIEHFGIEPDIIVLGKSLGSGMPISAVIGRREILDSPEPMTYMSTYSPHYLSCIAAMAGIEYIIKNRLHDRAELMGEYLMKRLNELKDGHEIVGDVRGKGLMIGVEIVDDKDSLKPSSKKAQKIIWRAYENGLIMMTFGKYGNVLRIAPPLTIEREEIDKAVEIMEKAISDVEKGKVGDEVLSKMVAWQ
ncbi:aminotransferase class III-fold pyridoxal phosphate-dependent enzyme, partial [Fervidicoccus fontis]